MNEYRYEVSATFCFSVHAATEEEAYQIAQGYANGRPDDGNQVVTGGTTDSPRVYIDEGAIPQLVDGPYDPGPLTCDLCREECDETTREEPNGPALCNRCRPVNA